MPNHPAIQPGRVAVITGGAGGIGLAAAKRFAALGMNVVIADLDQAALDAASAAIVAASPAKTARSLAVRCDVSRMDDVRSLKEQAYAAFGEVGVLMNNAGTGPGGGPFDHYDRWQHVIGVNLWGVINGVHAFSEAMIAQGTDAMIVNTGSKQGITCPPGDTAYNVSKAGVKVITEGLQHALRNTPGGKVTAHLLVPGWTHTGLTARDGGDEAGRRVVAGPGRRHDARGDRPRRLLHHLPRQRRDVGDRPQAHPLGGRRHCREPAAAVALAPGLSARRSRRSWRRGRGRTRDDSQNPCEWHNCGEATQ